LRGYGNAIVPQVAAEFVAACLDVIVDVFAAVAVTAGVDTTIVASPGELRLEWAFPALAGKSLAELAELYIPTALAYANNPPGRKIIAALPAHPLRPRMQGVEPPPSQQGEPT
jgi:hypothetical protein